MHDDIVDLKNKQHFNQLQAIEFQILLFVFELKLFQNNIFDCTAIFSFIKFTCTQLRL